METLKTASLNVRGMGELNKRKNIFNHLKHSKTDVIFLQETHVNDNVKEELWKHEWGGYIVHSQGTSASCGVAIPFRTKSALDNISVLRDTDSRVIIVNCTYKESSFTFMNISAPNKGTPEFFLNAISMLEDKHTNSTLVFGGDFNCVMEPELDRHKSQLNNELSVKVIKEFTDRMNLIDIWQVRNPDTRRYTWHRNSSSRHQG